jgi:hypothetical protein
MKRTLSLTLATVVAVLLAGCGQERLRSEAASRSSLTIESTVLPSRGGGFYTEGALVEVTLRSAGGHRIATKRAEEGRPIVFRGLDPGRYTVEPGLRPCDGNCGLLDPRTDTCTDQVDVPGTRVLTVRFVTLQGCTVESGRTRG